MLLEYDMTGLFTANHIAVCHHILADILIANGSLLITHSFTLQSFVKSHIGHHCGNNSISIQFPLLFQIFTADIHNLVTIDDISTMINCDTTVSISIIGKSNVQAIVYHIFLKDFDMGGSTVCIDVSSIRLIVDHISFRLKRLENTFCNCG